MKLAARSTPSRSAAASSIPGFGLRQSQPSASSCGHTTTSSSGTASRRTSFWRATISASTVPRAISGWFVTTTSAYPAALSAVQASTASGSSASSSTVDADRGGPSPRTARTRTPSLSRKTALEPAGTDVLDEIGHRLLQGLTRRSLAAPAERADPVSAQPHDRHVAPPTARAAGELVASGAQLEADALHGEVRDLADADVVTGRDVEGVVGPLAHMRGQHRVDHVLDVDVRLALGAVAENSQRARVGEQAADEVEPDAVGLPRADDVAEAKDPRRQPEHEAVRREQGLAGELAGPVGRDRDQRAPILVRLGLSEVAVHAAPRGVEDARHPRLPSRLDHEVREVGAFVEIDRGLGRRPRNVGVRREMDDHVMAAHRFRKRRVVLHVRLHDLEPLVAGVGLEVPAAARREVVVHRHLVRLGVAEQTVDEMAADEPRSADEEEPRAGRQRSDSHFADETWTAG